MFSLKKKFYSACLSLSVVCSCKRLSLQSACMQQTVWLLVRSLPRIKSSESKMLAPQSARCSTRLRLQILTLKQRLYFCNCRNKFAVCRDNINFAGTKLPFVFVAAEVAENWHLQKLPLASKPKFYSFSFFFFQTRNQVVASKCKSMFPVANMHFAATKTCSRNPRIVALQPGPDIGMARLRMGAGWRTIPAIGTRLKSEISSHLLPQTRPLSAMLPD